MKLCGDPPPPPVYTTDIFKNVATNNNTGNCPCCISPVNILITCLVSPSDVSVDIFKFYVPRYTGMS